MTSRLLLPQKQCCRRVTWHGAHSPTWHVSPHVCAPQLSRRPQTWSHTSATSHLTRLVVAPQGQVLARVAVQGLGGTGQH